MMQQSSIALPIKQTKQAEQMHSVDAAAAMQQTRAALQTMNLEELAQLRRAIQRELFILTYLPKILYGLLFCSIVMAIYYFQAF